MTLYWSIAPEDRGEDGWKGIHVDPEDYALCAGCGQTALKAFSARDAPGVAETYVCYHCVEDGHGPSGRIGGA